MSMFHVKQNIINVNEEVYNEASVTIEIEKIKYNRYFDALEIDEILRDFDNSRRNGCVEAYKEDVEIVGEIPRTVACVLAHITYCDFVSRATSQFLETVPTRRVKTLRKD